MLQLRCAATCAAAVAPGIPSDPARATSLAKPCPAALKCTAAATLLLRSSQTPVQILRVAKALAHTAKFRSALVNGGGDMGSQREQLERPLDVLVGTPQRVMQHAGDPCCGWVLSQ